MQVKFFEVPVVTKTADGRLLFALLDGTEEGRGPHECVALLTCRAETAQAMCESVGSALKDEAQ